MRKPWISCLCVDPSANWMICGGGGQYLAIWHFPSSSITSTCPTNGFPQTIQFDDDQQVIISAGNEPYIHYWKKSGKLLHKVKCFCCTSIFSLRLCKPSKSKDNQMLLVVTGNSPYIDIFSSPTIRAATLSFQ
eukprot:TRINITY_DN959_c0_g1_i4.p1 TRINITY_DN959_c0_g1~~TRINITY_DN959_c0_g1_i4.p1  ORF type:complete len:133 (+),score=19.17 TRINITY_DN959_c0_g1_i4:664-1062(+)